MTEPAASFDDFVRAHQAALVRYATLLCGSAAQAEDLVQEVLIRLYPRWGQLDSALPYVRRSVTNEYLSWRRRWNTRNVHPVPDELLASHTVDPFQAWRGPDPDLWAALLRLPKQQRAAVVLRYYEDLDDDEIARILGCKPASARGHISRGLAALRAGTLAREGGRDG